MPEHFERHHDLYIVPDQQLAQNEVEPITHNAGYVLGYGARASGAGGSVMIPI